MSSTNRWLALADRALADQPLTPDEGLSLLQSDDAELLDILAAAYRVRRHYFGNRVWLNFITNAKSGLCGENCGYCSQSHVSTAKIERYSLMSREKILDDARIAATKKASTHCLVISGRTPSEKELDLLCDVVPEIKAKYGMRICFSVGLLTVEQAKRLKAVGVDRINHNLNTSERFYPHICTTHTFQDRLKTLEAVRAAGMEICSGGIVGMGEEPADVVDFALTLGRLKVEANPINFLLPIPGTPLENVHRLNPRYCLKVLALVRLANPRGELRIAGGREVHLGPLQPLGLFAANSFFVDGYLTEGGQLPADDYRMIESLGFTIAH
jgi:biotin synthase